VRAAVAGFAPLLIAAPEAVESTAGPQCHGEPVIELEFAGKIIVRIPGSIRVKPPTPVTLGTRIATASMHGGRPAMVVQLEF
jgi:hypothetical protein